MRIRIDDDFDNDLEAEYKSIDNDTIVGNGALSKENIPIIDVKSEDIKEEESVDNQLKNRSVRQEETNKYDLDNGFRIEIQGATLLDDESENYINNKTSDHYNNSREDRKNKSAQRNQNKRIKENDEYIGQRVKGKIIVVAVFLAIFLLALFVFPGQR